MLQRYGSNTHRHTQSTVVTWSVFIEPHSFVEGHGCGSREHKVTQASSTTTNDFFHWQNTMGEEAGHRKCTTPLQAGPAEVEREALSSIDTRIVCNIWGSKIMAMLMVRAWMVPQLQNGCQEARKWATWVWSLQLRELSRRRTCTLASSLLLLSISLLLLTRG
ncbi:hypothetical protein DNTS_013753 [Danionella cerebrum]|uniref:Uncharacterized protein n=1 Tax=Danionella cerebrum TaxID=2873325 RepID=A0A553R5N7_9TELE|nr:hypothetical protein DNTS_013753 [Danionella translucida]